MTLSRIHYWSAELKERFGGRVHKISLDTGAGCPNRKGLEGGCLFCDERGGGSGSFLKGESLRKQIERGAVALAKRYGTQKAILYFQSYSSTYVPVDLFRQQIEEALTIAQAHVEVVGLSVGTRPDLVPEPILDLLDFYVQQRGLWVELELGIQTLREESLAWLQRGHGAAAIVDALGRCRHRSFTLCAHLIYGIPGESEDQLARSAESLADQGVHAFKFHPLYILSGTKLKILYERGLFSPPDATSYVRAVVSALRRIPQKAVIQRLTADAHPPFLIAPLWVCDKTSVIRAIESEMERENALQGDKRETIFHPRP